MVASTQPDGTRASQHARCCREELIGYLGAHGCRYFADFEAHPVQVLATRIIDRKMSALYEFALRTTNRQHSVIVKINKVRRDDHRRLANLQKRSSFDRPRIMPWITHTESAEMEHHALSMIQDHFEGLQNSRLGAIRVLDLLPDLGGIVVEKLSYANLRDQLARRAVGARSQHAKRLRSAVRNAGAWLREFHRLEAPAHAEPRQATRDAFVQLMHQFVEFLGHTCGTARFFRQLDESVERAAKRLLPVDLPLALSHGDFGARNVLVGPRSQAVGFDTRARCRAPIYDDLGYFLFMLDYDLPTFVSNNLMGASRLTAQLRSDFLHGYYKQEPIPRQVIALFELISLLDKWAPMVLGFHESDGLVRVAKRCRLSVMSPLFTRHAKRLLATVGG